MACFFFPQFQAISSCDLMAFAIVSIPAIISITKVESFCFIWGLLEYMYVLNSLSSLTDLFLSSLQFSLSQCVAGESEQSWKRVAGSLPSEPSSEKLFPEVLFYLTWGVLSVEESGSFFVFVFSSSTLYR